MPASGPIVDYIEWVTGTTDADPWGHLMSILPAAAHMLGRHGVDIDKAARRLRPVIWTCLIAPAASGKSTCLKAARSFYSDLLGTAQIDSPYLSVDGTVPGVLRELANRHDEEIDAEHAIFFREEFSTILKDQRGGWSEVFCELYDGTPCDRYLVRIHRARAQGDTSEDMDLSNPLVSASFASTTNGLQRYLTSEHIEGGLGSRMLWMTLETRLERLHQSFDDHGRGDAITSWMDWDQWILLHPVIGAETENPQRPNVIFDPDTDDVLRELFERCQKFARHHADHPMMGIYKRALIHAQVIAAIYAVSQRRWNVTADDMDRALNLIERCLESAERVVGHLVVESADGRYEMFLAEIRSAGPEGIHKAKLYERFRKLPKRNIDETLDHLLAAEKIEEVYGKIGGRGRPKTFVRVRRGRRRGKAV